MKEIIYILIFNICFILAILLFTLHSWLDKFKPDWYYIFNIYENDLLNYTQHKIFLPLAKKKDKYVIDNCEYDKSNKRPTINNLGVYEWNFEKGFSEPIYFLANKEPLSASLVHDFKKQGKDLIDDIVAGEPTIEDFLKTWGIVIVGLVLVILIMYMISSSQQAQRVTTELLINVTRKI